jgi:hypothetical protein
MHGTTDPFAPLAKVRATALPHANRRDDWEAVLPAPHPLPQRILHRQHGTPTAIWRYLDATGALLFTACRFDPPNAHKEVLPFTCGEAGWQWKAPSAPRPLYGLDRLAARPGAPVLIVEGEKTADAAALLFPDAVAITWQGGTGAVGKADWTQLGGRHVAIWPDADAPGRKAAQAVAKAASAAGAARVAVVAVPQDWPPTWDVADPLPEGITAETLRAMLARAMAEPGAHTFAAGAALRADVAKAAAMPRTDYLTKRLDMAKRHRVPVGELDALRSEATQSAQNLPDASANPRDPAADPRGRADLLVDAADLPDTATELAALLAEVPHLFDRGGPARIARDHSRGTFVVEALTMHGVVNEAHRIARPWCWAKARDGGMERRAVTLPDRVARLYLDHREVWTLRPLDGITSAPLLHPDGTVRAAEGYDATTRLWCERVPALVLPDRPSQQDAAAALHRLRRWFRTFAFADAVRVVEPGSPVPVVDTTKPPGADESAFLVGLLTAICRPCLWLAPGLLVRAPEYSGAGTGKGLLVRAACAVAFGAQPVALTAGGTAEELDKRLTAALMQADAMLFLDNVNSTALKSDVLASAITERPAAVRPLGRSAVVRLNPTAFVMVTGNGLQPSEDMARRFLTVELDAGMEDPEARDFRSDFLAETLAARESLLRDALVIWRWGRKMGDALPVGRPLGSFTDWGRWCRDPLLALGCADPALRVAATKAQDPRRQNIGEVFSAWWEAHGANPVAVADLAQSVRDAADPAGRGRQYLAAKIRALDGTRAAGFVLRRSPSAGRWSPDRYALRQAEPNAEAPQRAPDAPYGSYGFAGP